MKRLALLLFILHSSLFTFRSFAQRQIITERVEVTNQLDMNPDAEALNIMKKYKPAVDSVMAPVLGRSLVPMSAGRPESLLSNWAADVMMEFSDVIDGQKADLGLVNMGGLRNNMPEGTVRRGNILLISPFDNRLTIVRLSGNDLLSLFQDIAAVHGEGVSHEVKLVITADGKLVDAKVCGQPVDPERIYRIATLDYLAEGNDRLYSLKKDPKPAVSNLFTRDCMMRSIERARTITSQIEGRITVQP